MTNIMLPQQCIVYKAHHIRLTFTQSVSLLHLSVYYYHCAELGTMTIIQQLCVNADVQSLTLLSSPPSEGNITRSCPHTNVTITCTATQVATLRWYAVPGLRDQGYAFITSPDTVMCIADQEMFTTPSMSYRSINYKCYIILLYSFSL